jgi:hypothetical protein
VDVEINGPAQLRRIVKRLQSAILEQKLRVGDRGSPYYSEAPPDFLELDLSKALPDVMIYQMECRSCGQGFKLQCESYHGSGGSWQ